MKTETSQVLKTFREELDEHRGSNTEISENVDLLRKCLQENKNDNPSTKDIFDAVIAIRTDDLPPQTYINKTSSLVEAYLNNKKITPEQPLVNPLELFADPFKTAQNFFIDLQGSFLDPIKTAQNIYQDLEGSFKNPIKTAQNIYQDLQGLILGLSEESKFVNKILEEILQPRDRFDIDQTNSIKKNMLKAYFENHDVTYDDFKNLLKIHQIDDPKLQTEMLISFLKRGNLDETKFVKNVKDFLQDKEKLPADDKGRILEEYLVHRNEEVTKDKVSALADQIGLKIYSQETIDSATRDKINFSVAKNQGIKSEDLKLDSDVVAYKTSAPDARLTRSIEDFVDDINSGIKSRKPNTVVAATASNLETAPNSLVR